MRLVKQVFAGRVIAVLFGLVAGWANAAAVTWDANGTNTSVTDGPGAWLDASKWWDVAGSNNTTWASGDDASFGSGGTGGVVTLASPTTIGSLTLNGFSGTYTLGTAGQAITLNNGLANNAVSGTVTIASPITLGADQTWINNSANTLTLSGAVTNNGNLLTVDGAGLISFGADFTGSGGITKNGPGRFNFPNAVMSYTGPTTINGGVLFVGDNIQTYLGSGPLTLNGGVLETRWNSTFTRSLGESNGQVRVLGGPSGFGENGSAGLNVIFNNNAGYEVVWGAANEAGNTNATGYFAPSTLVLQVASAQQISSLNFQNRIDLNATTRTISVSKGTTGAASATLSGVVRTSSGTAGLTKTGDGTLILAGANTFNGPVAINEGTLSISSIANAATANALGTSTVASVNLLLANGTTLRYTGAAASSDRSFTLNGTADGHGASLDASGSGAINLTSTASPAYGTADQARTLILTGTSTATNTLAASIADNGAGAVSVTKTGSGTWVLSGASTYTGPNTLGNGTLSIGAARNLGSASASVVFNGGTLQITGTTLTNIASLGRAVVFSPGITVGLDIASAANTFTLDQVLAGSGGVTKSGAGTLVLNLANAYSGQTTISGGMLRYDDGAVIPITPLLNNASLVVNRSDTLTQGVNFHSIMGGTGTVTLAGAGTLVLNNMNTYSGTTKATAGTIALSHPLALMNSALDTTGAGAITLGGVTTPTFGGLSGASGDLAAVITSGYDGVTSLILNPSGTVTYGGVIADGAAGMTLTLAGTGTQILQGANPHAGATILNAGTLTLSGNGSLLNSAITLNGGGLTLANATAADAAVNRLDDSAGIAANGGTLTFANTSGTNVYAEAIGAVALARGQLNIVESVNQAGAGSQTLTLGGLTQSGSAAVAFSAQTTAPNATKNMITVSGASGVGAGQNLPGGLVVGPWATVGTAVNNQTDYAVYDASGYIVPANITASDETTWTTAANAYVNTSSALTLTATRTITALRNNVATATLTLASGANLEAYGVLNCVNTAFTIQPGTGGVLTTPIGGGNLYLTPGIPQSGVYSTVSGITVNAPINDNGGAVTLVKSGAGTLRLTSTASTFSGGIILNAGVVMAAADSMLGATIGNIVFSGSATMLFGDHATGNTTFTLNPARTITVNEGAMAALHNSRANDTFTFSGAITGAGGVELGRNAGSQDGGVGTVYAFDLLGNNTFTGALNVGNGLETSAGGQLGGVTINTLADSTSPITLNFGGGAYFSLGSGATASLSVPNRPVDLRNSNITIRNQNATYTVTLGSVSTTTTGAKTLTLNNGGAGGFVVGNITDGNGQISVTRTGTGAWTLSGTNTYSGITGPDNVTLTIRGKPALSPYSTISFDSSNGAAGGGGGRLNLYMDDAGMVTLGNQINVRSAQTSGGVTAQWTIDVGNNGGATMGSTLVLGKLNFASVGDYRAGGYILNVTGANGYGLQIGDVDLAPNVGSGGGTGNGSFQPGQGFNPTTAPLTITGTVRQNAASVASGTYTSQLVLWGTNAHSSISGAIRDPADYPGNANAKALQVVKGSTGTWTLSGTNTYSGTTTVSAGTLALAAGTCLPDAGTLTVTAPGKVRLNAGVKEKVGALKFGALVQTNGIWGSSASRAAFTNDTYFTGTGMLYVGVELPLTGTTLIVR